MGCDIHMHVEYKVGKDKWKAHPKHILDEDGYCETVSATSRNYELFALLAGVRAYTQTDCLEPKGLPTNVSKIIKAASDTWDVDGHSHSYITLKQFEKIIKKYNKNEGDYKISPTDRTDMFYEWRITDYKNQPPSYSTIISGCKRHAEELQTDYIILDEEPPTVKHRLIFWFDN